MVDLSRARDRQCSCDFNCVCSLHRLEMAASLRSFGVEGEEKIPYRKKKREKGG